MRQFKFNSFNTILFVVIIILISFLITDNKDEITSKIYSISAIKTPTQVPTTESTPVNIATETLQSIKIGDDISSKDSFNLNSAEIKNIQDNYVGLLSTSDIQSKAKYYKKPISEKICGLSKCLLTKHVLREPNIYSSVFFTYNNSNYLSYASIDILIEEGPVDPSDIDIFAEEVSKMMMYLFSDSDYKDIKDSIIIKSLALNFLSEYVPNNPKIPSFLTYKMPGYYLTFIMGKDNFSLILSFEPLNKYEVI